MTPKHIGNPPSAEEHHRRLEDSHPGRRTMNPGPQLRGDEQHAGHLGTPRTFGARNLAVTQVLEEDGTVQVTARLPGTDLEHVRIDVEGATLRLTGTHCRFGPFCETVALPRSVRAEGMSVDAGRERLDIRLPVAEP